MKPKARFIASVLETVAKQDVKMPWSRGDRRAEMIARRNGQTLVVDAKTA